MNKRNQVQELEDWLELYIFDDNPTRNGVPCIRNVDFDYVSGRTYRFCSVVGLEELAFIDWMRAYNVGTHLHLCKRLYWRVAGEQWLNGYRRLRMLEAENMAHTTIVEWTDNLKRT